MGPLRSAAPWGRFSPRSRLLARLARWGLGPGREGGQGGYGGAGRRTAAGVKQCFHDNYLRAILCCDHPAAKGGW